MPGLIHRSLSIRNGVEELLEFFPLPNAVAHVPSLIFRKFCRTPTLPICKLFSGPDVTAGVGAIALSNNPGRDSERELLPAN